MTDRRRPAQEQPSRHIQLNMRVSEAERDEIARRAAEAGLAVTAFFRLQCLGSMGYRARRVAPVELVELRRCMAMLGRLGSDLSGLNRIAALGEIPGHDELDAAVRNHREALAVLMAALGRPG